MWVFGSLFLGLSQAYAGRRTGLGLASRERPLGPSFWSLAWLSLCHRSRSSARPALLLLLRLPPLAPPTSAARPEAAAVAVCGLVQKPRRPSVQKPRRTARPEAAPHRLMTTTSESTASGLGASAAGSVGYWAELVCRSRRAGEEQGLVWLAGTRSMLICGGRRWRGGGHWCGGGHGRGWPWMRHGVEVQLRSWGRRVEVAQRMPWARRRLTTWRSTPGNCDATALLVIQSTHTNATGCSSPSGSSFGPLASSSR